MALLSIARMGHPVLKKKASPVSRESLKDPAFQRFLDDLIETMREYDGVGLAATQVHVALQVFVFEVQENPRYPDKAPIPLTVVINPILEQISETQTESYEACLSLPGLYGSVPRYDSLVLKGWDREGKPLSLPLHDFAARVVQHENDHLQGILFIERMKDLKTLAFEREYAKYVVGI